MRKVFLAVLCVTVLVGCWNKPFDLEAWNAAEDDYENGDYERCSMVANLLDILIGKSRAEFEAMFDVKTESRPVTNGLYVGACMLGCHGGGIVLFRVYFENDIIVKAERIRS